MSRPAPRIFLSAGEPSGDLHGAMVARALAGRLPGAPLEAFGGPRMQEAGVRVLHRMERVAAFGTVEIVAKIPAHVRLLRRLERAFAAGAYDLVILIDYPGFHLRVAEAAHRAGVPVLYYIAPQLWAWRPERAARLARSVDRLAVVLPFEEEFFARHGMTADYVGHPLLDRAGPPPSPEARASLGVSPGDRVLGLFPGSRRGEVLRMWPAFRDAGRRLLDAGACDRVVVAGTAQDDYPDAGPVLVHRGDPLRVMAASDAAIVKSGTTTLEAALADLPMVVAYRASPVTAWLSRRLLTVRHVSLVNLVAGREVVPELLQQQASAAALAEAVRPLLDRAGEAARAQRSGLADVRARLGTPGAADRVAAMAVELLGAA